ncbi:enoyl-CoA hydratase-related protein [Mycobacterium tilburgii]|uniref:enoyl-CoA hydratase-related protein n=1 Tax=Mycobacterium tilburgii TaxID=44467 RepID=UPI003899016D
MGAAGAGAAESGLQQLYDGPWPWAVARCRPSTAVNGAAVGAGLNLALAADVRIAGPGALFDPRFQKLGLHPGAARRGCCTGRSACRSLGPPSYSACASMPKAPCGTGWRSALPTIRSPRR